MAKRSPWLVFVLVAIAQFMVVLDNAITNVALPSIQHNLHFSSSSLQWVITAYALCFGGFLLLGGRAADLFGRRRMLLMGMIAFTTFSFLIGISQTPSQLIALRALQGMSAAFMSPAALSIVLTTFRDGPDRGKALGYWTLVIAGGVAMGVLLGGALTEYLGWRWNFFINVPIGITMTYLIGKFVPVHAREEKRTSMDIAGSVLVTAALMSLVFGFSQAPEWGWTNTKTLSVFVGAVFLLVMFIWNEARAEHPLMPLSIFKIRNVAGANLIMAPVYAGVMGTFFLTTLYMQSVLLYPPAITGLAFLPFPLLLGFMSTRIPQLVARYGYRRFLIAGPLLVAAGALWLSHLYIGSNYLTGLLPAFIIMPLGMGMTFMPTVAAATSGVPAHEAGLASGLISTSQQMGGALGLAIISGVATSIIAHAQHLGPRDAMAHGYSTAFLVTIAFMFIAASMAIFVIRQKKSVVSATAQVAKIASH